MFPIYMCSFSPTFIVLHASSRLSDVESHHCQVQKKLETQMHLAEQQAQQTVEVINIFPVDLNISIHL